MPDWTFQAFLVCGVILAVSAYAILRDSSSARFHTLHRKTEKLFVSLIDRCEVAPRVYRLRFALPSQRHVLGLPIGKHISFSSSITNPVDGDSVRYISRQYTPVTTDYEDLGYFDLIVKVYKKNEHPNFPEGGWMSQYLETLSLGASIEMRGPGGRIEYLERGRFRIGSSIVNVRHVGMIAGGTGITPMFQIIKHVLKTRRGKDSLKLSLLYGNQHPGDILLRSELETFRDGASSQFNVEYTVDRIEKDEKWSGHMGFVSSALIEVCMPVPSSDVLMLLCGPPPMVKSVRVMLQSMGYAEDRIYAF